MRTLEGYTDSAYTDFVGKDGLFWWVGEVEDNKDPEHLGRCRVRVAGHYTSGKNTATALKTEDLPWAVVLQGTDQAGNDGQGESSGQLQPGAIVMGFFMDGEEAQQPIVMGVLRTKKAGKENEPSTFAFSGEEYISVNSATAPPATTPGARNVSNNENNSVAIPNADAGGAAGSAAAPKQISGGTTGNKSVQTGMGNPGTSMQQVPGNSGIGKAQLTEQARPAANGVGGPWKTLELHLRYLLEDMASSFANITKKEDGNFIDMVSNKIVAIEDFMGKIKNFLASVFAAVIAALKEQLTILAGQALNYGTMIAQSMGIPMIVLKLIQGILKLILSKICGIDQRIIKMIESPLAAITEFVIEPIIAQLQEWADVVVQAVGEIIDRIMCQIAGALAAIKQVISLVKSAMEVFEGVSKIAEAQKAGEGIINEGFDLNNLTEAGVNAILGILSFILGFVDFGCNRKPQGGSDTAGYYPFLGVTFCDPESLASLSDKIGKAYGSGKDACGKSPVANIMDAIYRDASPYLTAAKTFVNGAYQLQMGTPGRQATVEVTASGASHTSIKLDNAEYMEHVNNEKNAALKQQGKEGPTDAAIEAKSKKPKSQGGAGNKEGKGAQVIGDHYQFPGHKTEEVKGDDCKHISGDYVRTVDGDYRLKVTGDCHIEIGGGLHLYVSQAPKQVKRNGKPGPNPSQNTKSTIMFASDVQVESKGQFELQAIGTLIGAKPGSDLKLAAPKGVVNISGVGIEGMGGEITMAATNTVNILGTAVWTKCNIPQKPTAITPGFFLSSAGIISLKNMPSPVNPLPQIMLSSIGEIAATAGAKGILLTTALGNITMTAGLAISAKATAAITMSAGAAMNLKAAAVMDLKAATIMLN